MRTVQYKKSSRHSPFDRQQPFFMKQREKNSSSNVIQMVRDRPFFSQIGFDSSFSLIQLKLTVGQPGDKYEREADAIADQVMCMPDPLIQRQTIESEEEEMPMMKRGVPLVQMKCAECDKEEESLHRKPLAGRITPFFQRQEANGGEVNNRVSTSLKTGKNGGHSLPEHTRNWMESRFGVDFSNVKIYTDSSAVQLNRDLGARAFTYGDDIYFNEGQYNPESHSGKHLLAHELAHVVQQKGKKGLFPRKIQREPASVTAGAVLAWCLSGAGVSVIIDQIFQIIKWWTDDEVKQNWCRTLFSALFGCVFGMAAGAIRTMIFSKVASFTIAELGLWIKQRLIAAGYTWLAAKWGATIALLGCDESDERL